MALCKECKSCDWEYITYIREDEDKLWQCKKCKRVVTRFANWDPNYEYNSTELI